MEFYLGASDYYFEGSFRWVETGLPVGGFSRWGTNMPSTNASKNCMVAKWEGGNSSDLVWADEYCDGRHNNPYYICEKLYVTMLINRTIFPN